MVSNLGRKFLTKASAVLVASTSSGCSGLSSGRGALDFLWMWMAPVSSCTTKINIFRLQKKNKAFLFDKKGLHEGL